MTSGVYKRRFKHRTKLPPASWCLRKPETKLPVRSRLVDRCLCPKNYGQWCVLWKQQVYLILPPTQLQKDIWLGEARRKIKEEVALDALRWYCHGCRTVQRP